MRALQRSNDILGRFRGIANSIAYQLTGAGVLGVLVPEGEKAQQFGDKAP